MSESLNRRHFLYQTAGLGALAAGLSLSFENRRPHPNQPANPDLGPEPELGAIGEARQAGSSLS